MASPRRIGDHLLNPLWGWPNPYAPRLRARLSASETGTAYAGKVGYLNTSGEIRLGLPTAAKACAMPLFLMSNQDDPDAYAFGGTPSTDYAVWAACRPDATKPNLLAIPACGNFEVETTEFVSSSGGSPVTYVPGEGLTATSAGLVTKGVAYTNLLCGVVSRGVRTNEQGNAVLALWTVWLPNNVTP